MLPRCDFCDMWYHPECLGLTAEQVRQISVLILPLDLLHHSNLIAMYYYRAICAVIPMLLFVTVQGWHV